MNQFSYDEVLIGTFFGKELYQRVINFGSLPAPGASKNVIVGSISDIGICFIDIGKSFWHITNQEIGGALYSMIYKDWIKDVFTTTDNGNVVAVIRTSYPNVNEYSAIITVLYTKKQNSLAI